MDQIERIHMRIKSTMILLMLAAVLVLSPGCSWMTAPTSPTVVAAATQASAQLDAVQTVKAQADAQIAVLQTQLNALAAAQAAAATQPASTVTQSQLDALTTKITSIQTALTSAQKISAQATPIITDLQAAAKAVAIAPTNGESIGNGITAIAPATGIIPVYGPLIALALGLIGTGVTAWSKAQAAAQANAAATSIVKSIHAAATSGQLTITPAGIEVLDSIQTPAAKDLVTAIQQAHGLSSLTTAGTAATTTPAAIAVPAAQ